MKTLRKFTSLLLIAGMLTHAFSPAVLAVANMHTTNHYAWSDQTGWINFSPTGGNVEVTDSALLGTAWSDTYGWVYLQPSQSGVQNSVQYDATL